METMDRIELSGLEFTAVVGVLPEERERAQPLRMDLVVQFDLTEAGISDRLEDTVDYGALCDTVVQVATGEQPELLERLAAVVADAALGFDPRITAVGVSIAKLRPPVPHNLDRVGVCITRRGGGASGG